MGKGIYLHKGHKQTEETKRKLSLLLYGKNNGMYGKTTSIKQKEIVSLIHKGKPLSEKHREKISKAKIGKGHKQTEETKRKISENKERRIKLSISLKGRHLTEKHKDNIRKARAKQVFPMRDTSIEIKIQNFLKQLGIEFFTHQYINIEHSYLCDILIPSMNLVLEIDGDYWHGNLLIFPNPNNLQLEQINEDRIRTMELIAKGFKVLRLWEFDVRKMGLSDFKERLNWGR